MSGIEIEAWQNPTDSYIDRLHKDRKNGWMPIHVLAESSFCECKVDLMLRFGSKYTCRAMQGSRNHLESSKERCKAIQEKILDAISKGIGVCASEVRLIEPALKLKGIVDKLEIDAKRGRAVVTEFKYTSKGYRQRPWPSHRLQSHAYGYMVDAIFGLDHVEVIVNYLDIESKHSLNVFKEPLDVQFFLEKYITASSWWGGERLPRSAKNSRVCFSCQYASYCKTWYRMNYISES